MLSVSSFASLFASNYNFDGDLEISGVNTLFNGKSYPFMLGDVYDDANATKIYTAAYLQTEYNQNGTVFEDEVAVVNNTNYKSPSNTDVSMIEGTFDDTDNMKANDDSYSNFISEGYVPASDGDPEYIDSVTYDNGYYSSGTLADTQIDSRSSRYVSSGGSGIDLNLFFDPVLGGRNFKISLDCQGSAAFSPHPYTRFYVNGAQKASAQYPNYINFDDVVYNGVNSLEIRVDAGTGNEYLYVYYLKIVEIDGNPAAPSELNFTIDLNFDEVDTSKLLALDVFSYHYTNVSTIIVGNVYDYDSSSYTEMFSSDNIAETENDFVDETSVDDYLDGSGNLRLKFNGTSSASDFKLSIDYIRVRFYYKMDITIDKTFYINGDWRYRFKIVGSLHYTDWTVFEVIDPIPNFYAISESDLTTRWILQGSDISPVEDFHDDINTDAWDLSDVSGRTINTNEIIEGDTYIYSDFPFTNYGTQNVIVIAYDVSIAEEFRGLVKSTYSYLDTNYTTNSTIYYYGGIMTSAQTNVYHTTIFNEYTTTWNNQPSAGVFQNGFTSGSGWQEYDIGAPNYYYMIKTPTDIERYIPFYSRESSNKPHIRHYLSKNYFGSGYMYMQTNTTELISLKSIDYTTHYNLSSGDYFEVDFQTSSDSKIELILLKDGVVNKTLTLSQSGNTNFGRHTAKISVGEFVEFDQLKISSTFEDTDNVVIYDVKTYKYTITGDSADFYVGSKRDYEVYLTPDTYNLRILEEGDEKVNINRTIPATGVLQYVYTPIEGLECRLTLFSLAEEYLQFEDFHVNISRSLGGIYGDFWLVDTLFYADVGTNVYIEVYDRFDALIYSDSELAKPYIDLYIEVYSLKIRNEATEIVDYTLQNIDTGSSKSGTLFSDEIVEYHVKSDNYSLDYTNYEDMYLREYNFELTTHDTISINSTYHTVYIGLFTHDGLGLNRDWVRLYINDVRADFGFNVIDSETMELVVLDYFNNTLANETIDASAYSEYNLYAQVYSLYLLNRFTYNDLIMNVTQVDSGMWMNQLIPASSALLYRFIPDVNYTISATYVNGTVYSIRTTNLTDNSQTESFGIPSAPEEYPKNVYFGVYTTTGLGIDHDLLRFYIDGTRADFGFNRITDMIVTLVVKDYFNTTLFNQIINTSGIFEYNILITLYSLQIKNLQLQETTVDVNTTLYEGTLLSEESLYFVLAENYYEIGYYDTNDVYNQFTIYLDSNQAYELNRSQICFLIYGDQQGNHLVFENYKTYLNGSRTYINNFYREIGDIVGIEIKDRYDISIKNDTFTVVSGVNEKYVVLTMYSLKVMSQQLDFNHINITRDPVHYESEMYWSEWIAPGDIIEFRLFAGYYVINITNVEDGSFSIYDYTLNGDDVILISSENTLYNVLYNIANVNTTLGNQITNVEINITNQNSAINNSIINIVINLDNINSSLGTMLIDIDTAISNINTSIINEIVSMGTIITNINTSIINQILDIGVNITNMNSTIISQLLTLGVDISNINGSIIDQIILLGVDVTNINTSLSNQILSIEVDISNLDTSITNQILLVIADIENVNSTIYNQTLVMLADISNMNSTILNQMALLGLNITNVNATIYNQILSLSVDLTNINASISNLLYYMDIDITTIMSNITSFYSFTNTSFINLNTAMNTSFIYLENNIISYNTTISNLIIGVDNSIYLINGTISTMITSLETNLLLMNVTINTSLFNLNTTINLIGSNITSNYILLNNSINLTNLNINDSRIAMINNLLLINNTISTLIANVYSAVYLVNNSIYTAVVDLGTYLSIVNNTISGNLSIVLEQNDFLTEIYQMTMFSDLLNWTDIGLNISLLTSQIDVWTFVNNYRDQAIEVHLRYNDIIDNLIISAQNTLDQYLPSTGTEYREWSVDLQEYIGEWQPLPENRTVDFGFYEAEIPYDPTKLQNTFFTYIVAILFFVLLSLGSLKLYYSARNQQNPIPPEVMRYMNKRNKKKINGAVDDRL